MSLHCDCEWQTGFNFICHRIIKPFANGLGDRVGCLWIFNTRFSPMNADTFRYSSGFETLRHFSHVVYHKTYERMKLW